MKRSSERFLTTHTGSLPRPDDLVRAMFAKEEGIPIDRAALAARIATAVAEIVEKQEEAGIDIVNDGELSKPSYATYIKDRLDGFGGESHPLTYQDLVAFPELARRVFGDPGRSRRKTPGCNGPIAVRDPKAAETDAGNLRAALAGVKAEEAFMSAASPGVVSLFFHNGHYASHEAYLAAIAEAMRQEYETVVNAGFILQIDCPDLAMGRHIQNAHLTTNEFRKAAGLHIEALNHALRNIPADRARVHLCWGNYEGTHHCDVPLADIIDVVLTAKPAGLSFEAANPRHCARMERVRDRQTAGRKSVDPRRHRVEDKLHRASGADRPAHRPLRRAGRTRERDRRQRLRLRHLGRSGRGRRPGGLGQARQPRRGRPPRLARILAVGAAPAASDARLQVPGRGPNFAIE